MVSLVKKNSEGSSMSRSSDKKLFIVDNELLFSGGFSDACLEQVKTAMSDFFSCKRNEYSVNFLDALYIGLEVKRWICCFLKIRQVPVLLIGGTENTKFFNDILFVSPKTRIQYKKKKDALTTFSLNNTVYISKGSLETDSFFSISQNVLQTYDEIQRSIKNNPKQALLISGESGSGKTAMVRYLAQSLNKKFVSINTASFMDPSHFQFEFFGRDSGAYTGVEGNSGLIDQAEDGILFLDEIGDTSVEIQNQLLTVIEDRDYCVLGSGGKIRKKARCTFIFATNKDLEKKIKEKTFKEDLFFRFSHNIKRMPSLSERPKDICHIINCIISSYLEKNNIPDIKVDASFYQYFLNTDNIKENIRGLLYPIHNAIDTNITGVLRDKDLINNVTPSNDFRFLESLLEQLTHIGGWKDLKKGMVNHLKQKDPSLTIQEISKKTLLSKSCIYDLLNRH